MKGWVFGVELLPVTKSSVATRSRPRVLPGSLMASTLDFKVCPKGGTLSCDP